MTKKSTYEVHNPHDAFFKQFLAKTEIAEDFLRHHLPPEVVEQVTLSTLELQKDSFIDVDLQEHFSDLLYRVPLKDGEQAYIYRKRAKSPWL
ncbi:MAG: Rpn family recombination-promoting nuclease/putative transposase [Chloroflexi bacterium]|nr:Rpn family recombination-promoting nuclease/putative transposase [Chloroflexota bacterium]